MLNETHGHAASRRFRFTVRVKPGASRTHVGGSYGEPAALIVAVNEQPVDGKANEAVVAALAKALDVKKADLAVVAGHTGRTKIVECSDESAASKVAELLAE